MDKHLDFLLALHRQFPSRQNFCWSPYSVASALGLLTKAVAGQTRAELARGLRADAETDLSTMVKQLSAAADLGGNDETVIAVANTLWAPEHLPIHPSCARELTAWPGSAVRDAPFQSAAETARQRINADVAETTRNLIPELLAPGSINPNTVAALVNALYLKTAWTKPFDTNATEQRAFHTPSGPRSVPTMRVTSRLDYAAQEGWQVLSIAAAGAVEAVVLLPDNELDVAEAALSPERLQDLLSSCSARRIELLLPQFEVTGDAELQDPLGELGVRTVFTREADFSPLTDQPMRVSNAVHESVLKVDENGLEGAAATAVMMRLTAIEAEEEPLRVSVDRPFLFVVRHAETGAVYFFARVVDPS